MIRLFCVGLVCVATAGWAVPKGGKLYVKQKGSMLLSAPKVGSPKVASLNVGEEVTWLGPSEKDKTFQEVMVGGKKGFVLTGSLSPNKPVQEQYVTPGGDGQVGAFIVGTDGQVGCVYGPGYAQKQYGRASSKDEAAAELIYVEELNKAKATPAAIDQKDKELRGR
jgi:hypothetical protein